MDASDSKPSEAGHAITQPPRRRWFQFRLRTLLLLVGACAVAAFLWRTLEGVLPYREQRRTMAIVEKLGGTYQTAEASAWHRRLFGSDLQNLVLVNLVDSDAADEFIGPVAGSPRLETLLVGGDAFGDQHLRRLQGAASLRHLVLDSTAVTDEAIAGLRAAQPKVEVYSSERRAIAALQKLGYVSKRSGLVPAPLQPHLPKDFFDTCHTGCFGKKCSDASLAPVRHLKDMRRLVLPTSAITDVSLSYFSGLKELRELHLGGNRITDAGIAHLSRLTSLQTLGLQGTQITDAGLVHLEKLDRLWRLDLGDTSISDQGLARLKRLTGLRELTLINTRVTDTGAVDLGRALPQCRVIGPSRPGTGRYK